MDVGGAQRGGARPRGRGVCQGGGGACREVEGVELIKGQDPDRGRS